MSGDLGTVCYHTIPLILAVWFSWLTINLIIDINNK